MLTTEQRLRMLETPQTTFDLVIDTDAYNEIDDQFAISYALRAQDRLHLLALCAAPFHNERSTGPADGMEKSYQEILKLLSLAGGDTAVTIKAAAQQTSGVNAAMAYGTDGPVAALGLQTLSDPQGVQPIYAPTPVVREAVLKAYPQIADWLQPVFASLDEKTLQQLNARIAVEGQDAKRVAADYLQQKGLLK